MSVRILALSTVTEICAVILINDDYIDSKIKITPNNHSQHIISLIDKLLKYNNCNIDKLNAVAFVNGPGSFTGIRIGMAIAQAISLGLSVPIISISSMDIAVEAAWRITGNKNIINAIDTKLGKVYWGKYFKDNQGIWFNDMSQNFIKLKKFLLKIQQKDKIWTAIGKAWQRYPNLLQITSNIIWNDIKISLIKDISSLVLQAWENKKICSLDQVKPIYFND